MRLQSQCALQAPADESAVAAPSVGLLGTSGSDTEPGAVRGCAVAASSTAAGLRITVADNSDDERYSGAVAAPVKQDLALRGCHPPTVRARRLCGLWCRYRKLRIQVPGMDFLEVFSGTGRLSHTMRRAGINVRDAIDLYCGPRRLDMASGDRFLQIAQELIDGSIGYVHFAPPYSSFSGALRGSARKWSRTNPGGPTEDAAIQRCNMLVDHACRLIRLASKLGIYWSLENPHTSLTLYMPGVAALAEHSYTVVLDQCMQGGVIPGVGHFRRRRRILTKCRALLPLNIICDGSVHAPVHLQGRFHHHGRWAARAAFATGYPNCLCRSWSSYAAPLLQPRISFASTSWVRLALIASGIEPHPGPQLCRHRIGNPVDLLIADVTSTTALRYHQALQQFGEYLRLHDRDLNDMLLGRLSQVVASCTNYMRQAYSRHELSPGAAGTLIAALKRYILLAVSLGVALPDPRPALAPFWRLHRPWALQVPPEFRHPASEELALAVALWVFCVGTCAFPFWFYLVATACCDQKKHENGNGLQSKSSRWRNVNASSGCLVWWLLQSPKRVVKLFMLPNKQF